VRVHGRRGCTRASRPHAGCMRNGLACMQHHMVRACACVWERSSGRVRSGCLATARLLPLVGRCLRTRVCRNCLCAHLLGHAARFLSRLCTRQIRLAPFRPLCARTSLPALSRSMERHCITSRPVYFPTVQSARCQNTPTASCVHNTREQNPSSSGPKMYRVRGLVPSVAGLLEGMPLPRVKQGTHPRTWLCSASPSHCTAAGLHSNVLRGRVWVIREREEEENKCVLLFGWLRKHWSTCDGMSREQVARCSTDKVECPWH